MLLFSTTLKISPSMTPEKFRQLVIDWNLSSPFPQNILPDLKENVRIPFCCTSENLSLEMIEDKKNRILACRHEKKQGSGIVWDTDMVMNFASGEMTIRLDRSYSEDLMITDTDFSTPHFITLLINNHYCLDDHALAVTRTALTVNRNRMNLLAEIINGTAELDLPVVYVSRTAQDQLPLQTERLAGRLKGCAHVLVQEHEKDNEVLKKLCNREVEMRGRIGIYYPGHPGAHQSFTPYPSTAGDLILYHQVLQAVFAYSNSQYVPPLATWQGVQSSILLQQLSTSDTLLDSVDEDLNRLQQQIRALSKANEALQSENRGLRNKLQQTARVPLLNYGNEVDYSPSEIREMILDILDQALDHVPDNSRRQDILHDIIEHNSYRKQISHYQKTIRQALQNFTGMNHALKQTLQDLGFEIQEEGKHIKLTYYGDERYQIILAKTPSDGRAGRNNAATIIRKVY